MDLSTQEAVKPHPTLVEMLPRCSPAAWSLPLKLNLAGLFDMILERLPDSPAYFDKDELTDRSMRFRRLKSSVKNPSLANEVPYSVEVVVEAFHRSTRRMEIAPSSMPAENLTNDTYGKGSAGLKTKLRPGKTLNSFWIPTFLDLSVKATRD